MVATLESGLLIVAINSALFVYFIHRLLKQSQGKANLVVDGRRAQKSRLAKVSVTHNTMRLRMFLLPAYCPDLTPDELLNQEVKTSALGKSRAQGETEMLSAVRV